MTRRDFIFIASIIKEVGEDQALAMDSSVDRVRLAEQFAAHLERANPSFDRVRFVEAATTEEDRIDFNAEDGELGTTY